MKTYQQFILEEAEKRLKMTRIYHGTSQDAAKKLRIVDLKIVNMVFMVLEFMLLQVETLQEDIQEMRVPQ